MRRTPNWMLCMVVLALAGCIESIPVEQQPYMQKVAIEGLIEPGTIPKVYVNTTVPFFQPKQTPSSLFIPDARVEIVGPGGADVLRPDSTYDRFWCRYEPFYVGTTPIQPNTTYELHVSYFGRTYTATATTDVPAVEIDSVSYVSEFTDIYGGHEGVVVDFKDLPGQTNQYRYLMVRLLNNTDETVGEPEYGSTCLTDTEHVEVEEIGRFVYFDRHLDGAPVRFVIEPAYTHHKGDVGTVYVQSMDQQSAEFYDTLDRQREANINPFVEPVFLHSNIEGAIGVFGAVNRSLPVRFVFPEEDVN